MKMLKETVCAVSLVLLFFSFGWAEKLPAPSVSYSADAVMEAGRDKMSMRVYHTENMTRQEMRLPGAEEQTITITRYDKKKVWSLIPSEKMYTEGPLDEEAQEGDIRNMSITRKVDLGAEMVGGEKTRKYQVFIDSDDPRENSALMWFTDDGIMMRMESTLVEEAQVESMVMSLSNVKRKVLDPALFRIPSGYVKMDFSAIMLGDEAEDEDLSDDDGLPSPPTKEELQEALDGLKRLFGGE